MMNRIFLLGLISLIISVQSLAQDKDPFLKHLKVESAVPFNKLSIWDTNSEISEDVKQRYEEARVLYNNKEYGRAHSHFQFIDKTSFQAVELYEYMGIIELLIERKDMGQAKFLALNNSIVDGDPEIQTKAIWLLAYSVYKQGMEKSAVKALEMVQKLDVNNVFTASAPLIIQEISR